MARPVEGQAFTFPIVLYDADGAPVSNPTLAVGDVRTHTQGGSEANIATLPTPSGTTVPVALSAGEMTGDWVKVIFEDAAGDEWEPQTITIIPDDAALSTLTAAAVNAEVDTALADYDAPTKAELDSAQNSIETDIAGVPVAVETQLADDFAGIEVDVDEEALATAVVSALGTGQITVVGPVAVGGDITIIRGDDYKAADGRSLDWSSTTWPDLTGASILLATASFEVAGSVVSAGGATQTIRVELEGDDTIAWRAGGHQFDITATLDNENEVTLVQAEMQVERDY